MWTQVSGCEVHISWCVSVGRRGRSQFYCVLCCQSPCWPPPSPSPLAPSSAALPPASPAGPSSSTTPQLWRRERRGGGRGEEGEGRRVGDGGIVIGSREEERLKKMTGHSEELSQGLHKCGTYIAIF